MRCMPVACSGAGAAICLPASTLLHFLHSTAPQKINCTPWVYFLYSPSESSNLTLTVLPNCQIPNHFFIVLAPLPSPHSPLSPAPQPLLFGQLHLGSPSWAALLPPVLPHALVMLPVSPGFQCSGLTFHSASSCSAFGVLTQLCSHLSLYPLLFFALFYHMSLNPISSCFVNPPCVLVQRRHWIHVGVNAAWTCAAR